MKMCFFCSAADWYITNYLHTFVDDEKFHLTRIYATNRKLSSIEQKVRPYVVIDDNVNIQLPDEETIRRSHIVVTTLTTAIHLVSAGLRGCFSHVLIDEAGQVLEAEALIPLALATKDTCVVLTGDHMQMSPKVRINSQYSVSGGCLLIFLLPCTILRRKSLLRNYLYASLFERLGGAISLYNL